MRRSTVAVIVVGAGVALASPAIANHSGLNNARLNRRWALWKLTVRNAARFAASKMRGIASDAERRAELDEQFAIRSAEDVARELGEMKGLMMKVGQMISFVVEALPDEAQAALASLQADAAPMAPTLAAGVVESELGAPPERIFREWSDLPVAAASIGQVHRARHADGRDLAVKVQYPGVREAIGDDIDMAKSMYSMFSALMLKGLDVDEIIKEIRDRMGEEIDYRIEARNLAIFTEGFKSHPWVRLPQLVEEHSTERVLTTEWIDGMSFDEFCASASPETQQHAAEVIWRFAQRCIHQLGSFNGDPHPGNYKFHHDGSVTFLDFGLVKTWQPGEWERLKPTMEAIVIDRDPGRLVEEMEHSGFLQPGHGLDPQLVFDYVSTPYTPYLTDSFTFSREWMREIVSTIADVSGPHAAVIEKLNLPASFILLDRVAWGSSAILSRLRATGPWRAMILEYLVDGQPVTRLGATERKWTNSVESLDRGNV